METSEVAESGTAESSESAGARTSKRRRELASDVDLWGSSPSSCVVPDSKKRTLFPRTPPNARSVVSVLLPNNTKLTLSRGLASKVDSLEGFVNCIQTKAENVFEDVLTKRKRLVRWERVFLEDWHGHRIVTIDALKERLIKPNVTILVQDGDSDTKHCHELNITPEPKMLGRLPQGYNVETALADEVAVWDVKDRRRLISVNVESEKINIFDTGLGMDAESIIFWGKPGGSMHRDVHLNGIGGTPPFLHPYLGKYGAGGVAAALHLGSFVRVSSKSKESKKVVTLDLSKDDLDKRWQSNQDHWLTPGQFRDMTAEETKRASGGSFTLIEISKLKRQYIDLNKEIFKTRCLLADIFYYYIQSEEFGVANRDLQYPIEFEVNGVNLAEVQNCETATLLQHRCNGAPFVLDLAFTGPIEDPDDAERVRSRNKATAHARLTCHYFPNLKGKEKLDAVIEELTVLGLCKKNFDDFPRVIIRWLGRLLPENGWDSLPFMKVVGRKEGWKDHWAKRVRATIELDAGFHPTQSKTQLERDQPFTVALQNLGDPSEMKKSSAADVDVVIKRAGKVITSKEFVDQYLLWMKAMHDEYDEEVEFLDSSPTYICDQPNIHELLGLTKDRHCEYAIVFYKHMRDSQGEWEVSDLVPLRVKIPKAVSRTPSDLFATIEWFYCQGSGGEDHGEVKMVVRPIDVPEGQGSEIKILKNGRLAFSLKKSKALAWTVPKTSKMQRLSPQEWLKKQEELSNKAPSHIEVLNDTDSKALNCDKTLPTKLTAGAGLPEFLVVVRPKKGSGASFKQQMVYPKSFEMKLKIYLSKDGEQASLPDEPIWVRCVRGCERNNLKGLYIFDIKGLKFVKQGTYNLCFELTTKEFQVTSCVRSIRVDPSLESKGWRVSAKQNSPLTIRLNEQLREELSFTKLDIYDNLQLISRHQKIEVSLQTSDDIEVLPRIPCPSEKLELSSDMRVLTLTKALLFREGNISQLGPAYEGCLVFHFQGSEGQEKAEESTAILKCRVYPGQIASVSVMQGPSLLTGPPISFAHRLRPNDIIDTLCLQAKDASENAVMKGQRVEIQLHNLQFRDNIGPFRELAEDGILDLGGLLVVIGPYNSKGSICIFCEDQHEEKRKLIEMLVTVASCRLQIAKPVRRTFRGGSSLEGVLVEILGEDGLLDTTLDGPLHSLTLGWMRNVTCPVIKGQCELPSFALPSKCGPWCGQIRHTTYKNLKVNLQLNLELGIASRLVLPADYHVISVRNDEPFMLNFLALDDQGQPATVAPDMVENMVVEVDSSHCSVTSFKISAAHASLTSFNTTVQLGGMAGSYAVVLRALPNAYPALSLEEQPGSTALLAWKVNLKPGKLAQLNFQIHQADSWTKNLKFLEIPRESLFPPTKIHLIDGYRNTCLLHDNQVLNLVLVKQGVGRGTSVCQKCKIKNGQGLFEPFEMEAPEGNYEMSISSASRPPLRIEPRFNLSVTRGENALTLRLTDGKPIRVKLELDVKLLKNLTLDVASVNDRPLRLSTAPVLELLASDQPNPSCSQKFVGQEVESSDKAPSHSKRFQFPPFSVPTVAGKYLLKFSLPDYNIPSCFRDLEIERADPSKLELSATQIKHGGMVARARVSDMYGNTCEEVSGLILRLELRISDEEFSSASANAEVQRSYYLTSTEEAVVKSGVAAFGRIETSKGGRLGKYVLRVVVEQDQKMARQLGHLKPSELSMAFTKETQELQLQESLQTCQENVKAQRGAMIKLKRQMEAARDESHRESAMLEKLLLSQATHNNNNNNNSAENNFSTEDEQILSRERARRIRSELDVMQDLDRLARRGRDCAAEALAFLQAREAGIFFAPNGPLAGEAIGLPVTLARVENEDFNKILCEYLTPRMLMQPICMTQDGVDALEVRRGGVVDTSCGLASVSQYPLTSNYDVLNLSDVRPWTAYGDPSHPQLLLKIPSPRLSGTTDEIPRGFLGYAVNLLHIKPEHLKIEVTVTFMRSRTFNLRETLFYDLLKTMQVYDTRENIMRAKSCNALSGGGMSLDGCLIKPNMRQRLGTRDKRDSAISFAMVPFEERISTCGLFPPACHAFKRFQSRQLIERQMEAQERQIQEARATCDQKRHAFERLSIQVADAGEALRLADLKEREVRKQQSSFKKNKNSNELLYTVR